MPWILDKILGKGKEKEPRCGVVVPAAGSASRMEGVDKILTPMGGIPILARTLQTLNGCSLVEEIVVVTRSDLIVPVADLCAHYGITKVTKVIVGGAERIHSVTLGVNEISREMNLIAIHDGARPFPSQLLLETVIRKAALAGAAAPAIPVVDTIKRGENGVVHETVDRSQLWAIQTPQVFEAGLIQAALKKAEEDCAILTDDCSAVERLGMQVSITQGEATNIKITTPFDLTLGEVIAGQIGVF